MSELYEIYDIYCVRCKQLAWQRLKIAGEPPLENCPHCGQKLEKEGKYPDDLWRLDPFNRPNPNEGGNPQDQQ